MAANEPVYERRAESGAEFDLRSIALAIWRRRWVVLGALGLGLGLAVVLTLRATPIYRATATVIIDLRAPTVLGDMREVYDLGTYGYWSTQEYYQTQYKVIRSRPVAEHVVSALRLDPEQLAAELEPFLSGGALSPTLTAALPKDLHERLAMLIPDAMTASEAIDRLAKLDAAEAIRQRIDVRPVRESRLVEILIEDPQPQIAARLANAVADAYMFVNLEQKASVTRWAAGWLADQTQDLKTKLEAAEQALHDFKEKNNIISVSLEDRQSMLAQTLTQLNANLSTARTERMGLDAKVRQLDNERTDEIPEVISNPLVQTLKTTLAEHKQEFGEIERRYTPEHPKFVAQKSRVELAERELDMEIRRIVASIRQQRQASKETEDRLAQAISQTTTDAIAVNAKEIDYNRLKRERDNLGNLYELVLQRQKEADLSRLLNTNNVRALEMAIAPDVPVRPRKLINIMAGLLLGFICGLALALFVDYLDSSVKTQAQIESVLGLHFLGLIPAIPATKTEIGERDQFILHNPRSSVAECCRIIRTNLLFLAAERPGKALMVTSSAPREGKSTTVVNLALTMAQSGVRCIIVDTDLRRPRLHRSFDVPNDVGISSVIVGEATLDQAIQKTQAGVDVLTCGPIPPNPAELLHTESFARAVRELGERYDRVLFDSPPVNAVTDALVLGSMVQGVVLVVHAGRTSIQSANQAKKRLQGLQAPIFGVILNNVDLSSKSYGYDYRYSYYRSGYVDDDEGDTEAA